MNVKVKIIKTDFVGTTLPMDHSIRGQVFEEVLAQKGNPVSKGEGCDYPRHGLEVKTKDVDSTSANSVGTMTWENIKVTPWDMSPIAEKIKQQYRVKVKKGIIINTKIYDFSPDFIQDKLREAYETARAKIIKGDKSNYIAGTKFGYFERKKGKGGKETNSWAFRIPVGAMDTLESMAKSNYNTLFE